MNVQQLFRRCSIAIALGASVLLTAAAPASNSPTVATNRFGGPVYDGAPALDITSSLLAAGGGAGSFSSVRALTTMVGADTLQAEMTKLRGQYGAHSVDQFVRVFDFSVSDAWRVAGTDNVTIPATGSLNGKALASALVQAGTATDNTFWSGYLLDKALSHKIHMQVMSDIDTKYGAPADAQYHTIANQLFYDIAKTLGPTNLILASDH